MQSGPRLIQLLQHDIRPILRKEDGNRDAMYLYSLGAWWVAFEGSAFQLSRFRLPALPPLPRCPCASVPPEGRSLSRPGGLRGCGPTARMQSPPATPDASGAFPECGEVPPMEEAAAGMVPGGLEAGGNLTLIYLNSIHPPPRPD